MMVKIMKKATFFILIILLGLSVNLWANKILIQAPGPGNNVWKRGTKHFIKWRQPQNTGNLILILRQNNRDIGVIKETYIPTHGSIEMYNWIVGDLVTGKAPVGKNYKIRIKIKDRGTFTDSFPFEIKSPL